MYADRHGTKQPMKQMQEGEENQQILLRLEKRFTINQICAKMFEEKEKNIMD